MGNIKNLITLTISKVNNVPENSRECKPFEYYGLVIKGINNETQKVAQSRIDSMDLYYAERTEYNLIHSKLIEVIDCLLDKVGEIRRE